MTSNSIKSGESNEGTWSKVDPSDGKIKRPCKIIDWAKRVNKCRSSFFGILSFDKTFDKIAQINDLAQQLFSFDCSDNWNDYFLDVSFYKTDLKKLKTRIKIISRLAVDSPEFDRNGFSKWHYALRHWSRDITEAERFLFPFIFPLHSLLPDSFPPLNTDENARREKTLIYHARLLLQIFRITTEMDWFVLCLAFDHNSVDESGGF